MSIFKNSLIVAGYPNLGISIYKREEIMTWELRSIGIARKDRFICETPACKCTLGQQFIFEISRERIKCVIQFCINKLYTVL